VNSAERNNAGNALTRDGSYDLALLAYQAAQVADPDNALVYFNTALSLQANGDFAQAIAAYQQAILRGDPPTQSQAAYNLGNLYFERNQFDDAITAYQQALLANPNNEDARYNLEVALRYRTLPTPTPIEMQTNPELGQADPNQQPSPIPGGGELSTPTPSPESPSGPTPNTGGQTGDNVADSRVTPVAQIDGKLDVEAAKRLMEELQFEQDNIGLPRNAPAIATPSGMKDW
jgi:tetratricopeptide (TPR) repeat protein